MTTQKPRASEPQDTGAGGYARSTVREALKMRRPGHDAAPSRAGSRGPGGVLALLMLLVCIGLSSAASALGAVGHAYLSQMTEAAPGERLTAPNAVAVDSNNNVWVADLGRGVVSEFDPSGALLRQTEPGHFGEGGKSIFSIAVAPSTGDLYVADTATGVVDVFDSTAKFVEALTGPPEGFQKVTGQGELGVAIDPSTGDVYVASNHYHVIDRFNSANEYQLQIPVPPNVKSMAAADGSLYDLIPGPGLSQNGNGQLVEKRDSGGSLVAAFGDTSPTPDGRLRGRLAPQKSFFFEPTYQAGVEPGVSSSISSGMAVDAAGHLYIVNSRRKGVDEFTSSGEYLGQIGGRETPAHHFIDPGGVAVNSSGEVYLSDFDPLRPLVSEGEGVVDVFGPDIEQHALALSVTGPASRDLGSGLNWSVLSSPTGIEEVWGCGDPIFLPRMVTHECNDKLAFFRPSEVFGCEWECTAQFAPGTKVALTQTPGYGFKFKEWSKACTGSGSCEVTLSSDLEVGAEFAALPKFALTVVGIGAGSGTVTSNPTGIECPSTCSHEFSEGEVALQASPAPGSEFKGFSGGGCSGAASTCKLSLAAATEVTAEFAPIPQRTLTVLETGSGGGSVSSEPPGIQCPSACSHAFDTASKVTLSAHANPTSRFIGFSGGGCSGTAPCEVTLNADTQVTAQFEALTQATLSVSVSGSGAGVVSSEPVGIQCGTICSHAFNEGTTVKLTATPTNATSTFLGWSGACAGNGACEVSMSGDLEASATFASVPAQACPNEQMRSEQLFAAALPDCRAYEMVSPVDKNNNDAAMSPPFYDRAAVSGDAVTYESRGSFSAPTGAPFFSQYLSRRAGDGWTTQNISPPTTPTPGESITSQWMGMVFTGDLSKGLVLNGLPALTPDAPVGFENLYVSDLVDGGYQFVAATPGEPYEFGRFRVQVGGASADLSHIVFEAHEEVFEWAAGHVSPVSDGGVAKTGAGGERIAFDGGWHAVSADGSRVFFTRREPGFENPEGQLFVRKNESATVQVSASQRTVTDPHGPQPAVFWGASADGSRVLFTSAAELTDDANTGSADDAANLYEFDVETGSLKDLTVDHTAAGAAVDGVLAMSEDASHVYFVAHGVLASGAVPGAENLYLSDNGVTSFIATLAAADGADWAYGINKNRAAVTPDGDKLAFQSGQSLTGYDNRDQSTGEPDDEVFLYDAEAGKLVCASCNPSGARPAGASSLYQDVGNGSRTAEGYLYKPRNFSDDGSRLFFQSADALVPQDGNGLLDVYEYQHGFVSLISNGAGSFDSFLQDVSASGDDVFFATADQLVGQDHDNLVDLYDARVNGGFPAPASVAAGCESAELCKLTATPPLGAFAAPLSAAFTGPGNLTPAPPPPAKPAGKPLTRAQKLAKALKACRKKPRGKRRAACERKAHKLYAPAKKRAGGSTHAKAGRS